MSDEFFPLDSIQMDSPRLRWMKANGITVRQQDWQDTDFEGTDEPAWQAFSAKAFPVQGPSCKRPVIWTFEGPRAQTEDDALTAIALAMGIKLWNEE